MIRDSDYGIESDNDKYDDGDSIGGDEDDDDTHMEINWPWQQVVLVFEE